MVPGLLLVGVALAAVLGVAAQDDLDPPAQCQQGYPWMNNAKGQDPCTVSVYLEGACDSGTKSYLPPLDPGHYYVNPGSDPCSCNTVFYSVISACVVCQSGLPSTWQLWSFNCSKADTANIRQYPFTVPSETTIPAWAYLDVVMSDRFNATEAYGVVNGSIPAPATPGDNDPSASATSNASSSSASSTATRQPTSAVQAVSTTNKTPIIAGVVGGVGGAGFLAAVIFGLWWMHRRTRPYPARTESISIMSAASPTGSPHTPTFMHPGQHEKTGSIDATMSSINKHPNTLGLNYGLGPTANTSASGTMSYSPLPNVPSLARQESLGNINNGRTTPTSVKSATYPHSLYYNGLPQV